MADFKNLTLTTLGAALLEKAIAGTTLEFTRAAIGDGRIADGTDISGLMALVNEKKSIPIQSIVFNDGLATVTIVFSNSDLSMGFHVRELGLFAKDPEKGEILYAVANAGDDSDWLPEMGSNVVEEVFKIVPVISGATKVTAVMDSSLTHVTKEEFAAHHHVTGGQNDGEPVEAKDIVNTPSGFITATTVQGSINQAGLSIAPPETDYIINSPSTGYGGKFTPNGDLSINVSPFEAMIGRKYHKSEAVSNFTLNPRKASIIYTSKNSDDSSSTPTLGHYDAVYPEADSNTVLRYVFNEASGQVIDSSGNGNDGNAYGTITRQVDGWADYAVKGDGGTGYITSSSSITAPIGAAAREMDIIFTPYSLTSVNYLCMYGGTSTGRAFGIYILASGNLGIDFYGSAYDTGYNLSIGQTYYVAFCYDGTNFTVFVNGNKVYSLSGTIATTAAALKILVATNNTYFSNAIIHYVELRSAVRAPQQIAQISNQLCIPCHYGGYSASYPDNDITSGAHIYKFDDASETVVTDEKGTMNGTVTGTTIVNSGVGLGKARKFNGTSDFVSLGTFAWPTAFTVIGVVTPNIGTIMEIFGNVAGAGNGVSIEISNTGLLEITNYSVAVPSTNYLNSKVPNFIAISYSNGIASFYVNSNIPESKACTNTNTLLGTLFFGKSAASNNFYSGYIDYFAYIPRVLSQAEILQYYNTLMAQKERTLIDDCLPASSSSLGFVRTGSYAVIEFNDMDFRFMRNEGATKAEGNKRVFLGCKYFNGGQILKWDNPFSTRKIKTYYTWAQDANGTNECDIFPRFDNNISYGLINNNYTAQRIEVGSNAGGVACFNGVFQTSGYIRCYAEVL